MACRWEVVPGRFPHSRASSSFDAFPAFRPRRLPSAVIVARSRRGTSLSLALITSAIMPLKRKAPAAASSSAATTTKGPRPSKLARENKITAQEEAEIREAFGLFSEPMDGEKDGVLPIGDLRRALIALGIPPSRSELAEFVSILDSDDEGFATYPSFVAVCALKLHSRAQTSGAQAQEVDEAFKLFASHGQSSTSTSSTSSTITMAHLRRIAATLKEDVADDVLRDMVLEANGGAGVTQGVDRDAFESVMRRAGVWR